jgi:hypothetical protein
MISATEDGHSMLTLPSRTCDLSTTRGRLVCLPEVRYPLAIAVSPSCLDRTLAELTSVESSEGEPLFFNYSRDMLRDFAPSM